MIAQGEGGGVFLVLVAEEELLVQPGVVLIDLGRSPGAQVEVLIADQQVVADVEALAPCELLIEVDPELVSPRYRGANC